MKGSGMLHIYTDGSFRKPNIGAYGYVVVQHDSIVKEFVETKLHTTNNIMELTAIKVALEYVKPGAYANIYSDSQYAVFSLNKWVWLWKKNDWKTRDGSPVKNRELFEAILKASQDKYIKFIWVKGHDGNRHNERCDELVQNATLEIQSSLEANSNLSKTEHESFYNENQYVQETSHGFDITKDDDTLREESEAIKEYASRAKKYHKG